MPKANAGDPRDRLGGGQLPVSPGRKAAAGLLGMLALMVLGADVASAQCGETVDVPARHSVLPGAPPLALGDSVLYDAAGPLSSDGFHVNAMVCRTMGQGITYLQLHRSSLAELVIVALGTNGTVTDSDIATLLGILGPSRGLALVTPKGGDDPSVAGLYRAAAAAHPGRILVLDWERVSAGHADWFAPDGIHLGGSAGIAAYARLLAGSLSALPGSTTAPTTSTPASVPAPTTTQPPPVTGTTGAAPASGPAAAAVARPQPAHRPSITPGERDALRRIMLDVRLLLAAAVTNELLPFAL
jgi:hypothetical protein